MTGTGIILAPWLLNSCQPDASEESADETSETSTPAELFFKISLAEWSLNRQIFKKEIDTYSE